MIKHFIPNNGEVLLEQGEEERNDMLWAVGFFPQIIKIHSELLNEKKNHRKH